MPGDISESTPRLIVIDGPAGAGKTSVARALALAYHLPLLDTGAIYRTLALVADEQGIPLDDEPKLVALCHGFPIQFGRLADAGPQRIFHGARDVTEAIRTPQCAQGASKVSALPGVRAALLGIQRAQGAKGAVAEGRDMGTVVFPDARHKFFLTADLRTRAMRRLVEQRARGLEDQDLAQLEAEIEQRDQRDQSRAHAPLMRAADAIEIDTSGLDLDQVIAALRAHIDGDL